MRIEAEGDAVIAPRALLLDEFDSDEPGSCAVFVLPSPVYVELAPVCRSSTAS